MKKILVYISIITMVLTLFSYRTERVYAAPTEDYKTFSQGDERWNTVGIGTSTVGKIGCFVTAIAVLMAYANPDLRDVSKFNPGIFAKQVDYSGNGLISTSVNKGDPTFTKVKDVDKSGGFTAEEAEKEVNALLDEGYYVTVKATRSPVTTSGSHFSPIVGRTDDGKLLIWDVNGGHNSKWETWANCCIDEIDVFQSSISKSYDNLQGGSGDGSSNSAPTDEAIAAAAATIVSEDQLTGMYDASPLRDAQEAIELQDGSQLSLLEKKQLAELGDNISISRNLNVVSILIMFMGIVLMVYAILLFVGAQFDLTNEWIEISAVERLTFGKCRIVRGMDKEVAQMAMQKGDFGIAAWRMRCVVMFVLGVVLISGLPYRLIAYVVFEKLLK